MSAFRDKVCVLVGDVSVNISDIGKIKSMKFIGIGSNTLHV